MVLAEYDKSLQKAQIKPGFDQQAFDALFYRDGTRLCKETKRPNYKTDGTYNFQISKLSSRLFFSPTAAWVRHAEKGGWEPDLRDPDLFPSTFFPSSPSIDLSTMIASYRFSLTMEKQRQMQAARDLSLSIHIPGIAASQLFGCTGWFQKELTTTKVSISNFHSLSRERELCTPGAHGLPPHQVCGGGHVQCQPH